MFILLLSYLGIQWIRFIQKLNQVIPSKDDYINSQIIGIKLNNNVKIRFLGARYEIR